MQKDLKDSTDTLIAYPPALGVPSSATVKIQTPSTAMPSSGSAGSVDGVSASPNSSISEGDTTASFASDPTFTNGRDYLVTVAGMDRFVAKCLNTGTTSTFADPFPADVSTSGTFKGIAITIALTSAQTSAAGDAIARWTATINGVAQTWEQQFKVAEVQDGAFVNSAELVRMYPIADRLRPPTDETLTETIDAAWELYLRPDLEAKGMIANQIKSWERLKPVHATACIYHLVSTDERQEDIFRDQWRTQYAHALDLLLAGSEFWYSTDDTETGTTRAPEGRYKQRRIHR